MPIAIVIMDHGGLYIRILKRLTNKWLKKSWDGRTVGYETGFGFSVHFSAIRKSELVFKGALPFPLATCRNKAQFPFKLSE